MLKKILESEKQKVTLSFISVILFVYIILFEFIIPANGILPKPSILIDSVFSLFDDYNFAKSYLFTFTSIYSSIFISYFFISIIGKYFRDFSFAFPGLRHILDLSKYFIPFFLVMLFELWFGNSILGEYLFTLIIIVGILKVTFFSELISMEQEYIFSAKSLGINDKELFRKIIWKTLQPKIFNSIKKNHIVIWSSVFIYEFICKTDGIGNIFYTALKYNDLSVLLTLFLFLIITFVLMESILEIIRKRFFYWE